MAQGHFVVRPKLGETSGKTQLCGRIRGQVAQAPKLGLPKFWARATLAQAQTIAPNLNSCSFGTR